jgi:tagatose 6-phosphate kinase
MPPSNAILTVTLNAALDVTYQVPNVRPHHSNRVVAVTTRAGGKGLNVARVAARLGRPAVATGLIGGSTGAALRRELTESRPTRLLDALQTIGAETRRTVAVVDPVAADTTVFNEPGPTVAPGEWADFQAHFGRLLADCGAVVLSGSVPPGLPLDAYAALTAQARAAGRPVLLDTSAPWLLPGLAAGPDVVKPNADELREATGLTDPLDAARALLALGAGAVVASLGPGGLLAVTPHGSWRAVPPEPLTGNPTGAGDSAAAALALGLLDGSPWPGHLAQAVALSAATVRSPLAGDYDEATYRALLPHVRVTRL